MWTHWADELTQNRRLIRYDARGGGMSDWCPPARSPEQWVDVSTVADAAGLDHFPLVPAADGTAIAIAYAALRPERVTRMILVSTHARGRHARADTGLDQKAAELDLNLATIGWQTHNRRYLRAFASPQWRRVVARRVRRRPPGDRPDPARPDRRPVRQGPTAGSHR
jgi:pimeloyl-ACP methyl ester carboxylesterase